MSSARILPEDKNNIAPRVGFSYDVNGDGRFLLRGGYGRYYDFAYTNANILFAVVGAQSSFGTIYLNNDTTGIKNADGSLFQVGQPLPANELASATAPLPSHAASPASSSPTRTRATWAWPTTWAGDSPSSWRACTRRAASSAPVPISTCGSTGALVPVSRASCPGRAVRTSVSTPPRASPTTRARPCP